MQAFLRDELLAFCREAPPEFNEHQRDVFCVFSGTGVARLREFLNEREALAASAGSAHSSVMSEDLIDVNIDDHNPDSDGSNTPIVSINVHGNHTHGHTPIMAGPAGHFPPLPPQYHTHAHPYPGMAPPLSQSAPATTATWAGVAGMQYQHLGHAHYGGHAHHVTGMMGATVLDEVDGDEAFGEDSELMEHD